MILEVFSDLNGSKGIEAAPGGAAGQGRAHLCHLQIPCGLQETHHLWYLRVFGNLQVGETPCCCLESCVLNI